MNSGKEININTRLNECDETLGSLNESKQITRVAKIRFKKKPTKVDAFQDVPKLLSAEHLKTASISEEEERKILRKQFLEEKKKMLKNRYPASFAGKSYPEHNSMENQKKIESTDEYSGGFVPTFTTGKAKNFVKKLNVHIDTDNQKISDILVNDDAKKFQELLKTKIMAKKAINRLLSTRLESFLITRIMGLWYMLRKQYTDNVDIPKHNRRESFEYLYSVHKKIPEYLDETRRNVILTMDDPSWIWLLTLKECWHPSMAEGIRDRIRQLDAKTVINIITPVIKEYHEENSPYVTYEDMNYHDSSDPFRKKPTEITEIPSMWFRQLLYPLLGGEPRGVFNDKPMSHSEKLSTILSFS